MKLLKMSFFRDVLKDERGQTLIFVAAGMLAILGISGISLDLGHAYIARQALQASTNSAALSGATYIFTGDTADAAAAVTLYSATSGGLNQVPQLTNVQLSGPTYSCLNTVTKWGTACVDLGATVGGTIYPNGFNTMAVTQTADVKTWFASLFGIPVFHLSATAYAAPGASPQPLNMAVILDSTLSMGATVTGPAATSDPQCSGHTEMYCALNGIGILLNSFPDPSVAPVALFTFPNVAANTVSNDISPCGTPTEDANSTPTLGSSYDPTGSNPTYMIVPFRTDYTILKEAIGTVNPTTNATNTPNGCMTTSSGAPAGTYLAGAIVAAQSALVAEQVVHPVATGQNIMLILTDGNVNGTDQYGKKVDTALTMFGSSFSVSASSPPADVPISGTSVTYPSGVGGCGQAVQVAQAARASTLQTSIFVVAYGSPITGSWNPSNVSLTGISANNFVGVINASNCPSDQDAFFVAFKSTAYGTLPTSNNVSYMPNITPCQTATDIASPTKVINGKTVYYFFADDMGASTACPSDGSGSLATIFKIIAGEQARPPRLLPAGTS